MTTWADVLDSKHKRASSANVIIEDTHGRLLVVKAHYKPYWSLPGGFVDEGDTPRRAAIREVSEEIGLELRPEDLEFAAFVDRMSDVADTYLFVFRLIDPISPDTKLVLQSDEIEEYDWVTISDVHNSTRGHYNTAVKNWASDTPETYIEQPN